MLDLLKDYYNCFLLFLIDKHVNKPIIHYNFPFLIEKSFWNLSSLLHSLTYHFWICLNDYYFRWLAYKSLLSRFWVLINYFMWSYNLFLVSNVFYDLGFSGSESRVWNQVLEVAQLLHIFSYVEEEKCENKSKVHKIRHYTIIK